LKLNKQYIYSIIYAIVLIVFALIPTLEAILITSFVLVLTLSIQNESLDKYFINLIILLSIIIFIGMISIVFRFNNKYDVLKDILYYMKPILMLIAGYLIAKKIGSIDYILKAILFVAVFSAIKHIITFMILVDFSNFDINKLRYSAGLGAFIELIAIILLVSSKKYKIFNVVKKRKSLFMFLLITSFILYFSRTMLLGLVIISLTVFGYAKLNVKGVKYASILLLLITVFYTILFNIKLESNKPGLESFFYKIRNTPIEMFSSPEGYNSDDHRNIFDRWRAYEAKMALQQMNENNINYFFGKGFGSLVDLKFIAPLNNEGMRYIPIIHNGYVYVFFKTGFLGLMAYLLFLGSLYFQSYKKSLSINEKAIRNLISGLGFYYIATSFVIVGIYNLEEPSSFLLGSFLFLLTTTRKTTLV